ncbi:uncharacterized protein [Epargyreus clarus]|uniref:uncharacterized protein isoform X2 n=1 Tax=Epargyreus clarus TaxID=520877 RepID=UPI003C2ABF47
MDSAEPMSQNDSECQILNILKAVLFVVVSAFVLYVPLGDPQVACETIASAQNRKIAYCCICEAYAIAVKIVTQLIETIKFVACLLMDLLYEAKLGIYGFLDKVDRNDICKSVCCNAVRYSSNID